MRIAIIGTYPPIQCGIATFTHDLYKALVTASGDQHGICAVSNQNDCLYPKEVFLVLDKEDQDKYFLAAEEINRNYDACIIQHEYGIFGGADGNYIIDLIQGLTIPVVSNFHTVLEHPSPQQHAVLTQLSHYSDKVTVMTDCAISILESVYSIPTQKIELIPHGVPTFSYNQDAAKQKLGLSGKKVMLSFGFLGRNKGIETALDAVANVKAENFVYIVLGTTHPNILKEEGESYRQALTEKAEALNITHKIEFKNCFASEDLLIDYLDACDIYVTPYPNKNQISSGTLSFALGAGAAVLSTPYFYAQDLLSNNRGLLFPFNDPLTLASHINELLDNPTKLKYYRKNAATYGRSLAWPNIGKRQMDLLNDVRKKRLKTQKQFKIKPVLPSPYAYSGTQTRLSS